MAEESKNDAQTSEQFVVVICTSSGKMRRFALGVKAGFALSIINKKLGPGDPLALYIEAAKEGEEPIVFAPESLLRSYGTGWKLHTVVQPQVFAGDYKGDGTQVKGPKRMTAAPVISYTYIWKVILAFGLIFLLGAVFTLALESLPRLILFIRSTYGNVYPL